MATTRTQHRAKIADARNVLGEVISRARFGGEPTVLMNRGKEAAVILSFDLYVRAMEALGEEIVEADPDWRAAMNIAAPAPATPKRKIVRRKKSSD
jgi:prevent-host-death family protein